MYRRILIAADPQGLAAGAAPAVAALAEPDGAQVRVLMVARGTEHASGAAPGDEVLQHLAEELQARHLRVEVERRDPEGTSVAEALADAAGAFDADLVVLGSRRRGDVAGFFVGSVGRALATRLDTPMLIVSQAAERPTAGVERVVVGVDGGPLGHQAVVAAAALAGPETKVIAVYVDNPATGLGAYPVYVDPTPTDVEGAQALDGALDVLRGAGVQGEARRVYGLEGTGAAIAQAADELEADLIVLGSRRPGNVEGLLVGSVAQSVIAHTRRTVLLAPGVPDPEKTTAPDA